MTLADEQLPVAEAFANAQAALQACEGGPVQGDLPGILPAFNFKGCYLELEEKAAEVNRLHEDYLEKKEEATDAKKLWDKAAELYTKMALEFRRRRQAKGEPGPSVTDPVSRALVCVWDKAHPDDACPLCAAASITERTVIVRALGAEILPGDAQAHAEQVVAYRAWLDVQDTVEALAEVIFDIPEETIAGWSGEERAAVRAWKRDNRLPMPVVLGRPHIAASVEDGAKVQTCATCGAVIKQLDDVKEAYWSGDLVRTDCAGAEPDGHHYPERKPKPTSRRKSVADTAEHVVDAGAKVSIRKKPAAKGAKKKGARS
jgi:hypothetical protein